MGIWTMALPGLNPLTALLVAGVAQLLGGRAGLALGGGSLIAAVALAWRALPAGEQAAAEGGPR